MTHWTFDLRSSDSDIEDEENLSSNDTPQLPEGPSIPTGPNTPPQLDTHIPPINPQDPTAKELDELFGASKDEEAVDYKPNPWSIAKMNANARASGAGSSKPKKPPIHNWRSGTRRFRPFGPQNVWRKSGFVPRYRDGNGNLSPEKRAWNGHRKPGQLRDSISAALRRDILSSPTESGVQEAGTGFVIVAPETDFKPPSTLSHSEIRQNISVPAGSTTNDIRALEFEERPSGSASGAYIHQNGSTIPQAIDAHLTDSTEIYPPIDTNLDNQLPTSSSFADRPPISNASHKVQEASVPTSSRSINKLFTSYPAETDSTLAFNPRENWTGQTPQRVRESPIRARVDSPNLVPKFGGRGDQSIAIHAESDVRMESGWAPQADRFLESSHSASTSRLEPSPTLQLIAKYAAPPPPVLYEPTSMEIVEPEGQYAGGGGDHEQPPSFARGPPSPVSRNPVPRPRSKHQHQQEAHAFQTPKRGSVQREDPSSNITSSNQGNSTSQWQPITPPRETPNRSPMVPMKRFDPDDKPFWSTLPTPKSAKQSKSTSEVTTTRFRLPGVFLGGSPLGGPANTSTKTLYKPPPRKRPHSPEDDSPLASATSRWKVTRIL